MRPGLAVALVIFILDQLTKQAMWDMLFVDGRQIVLAPFLNLTPVLNRGISFGMFPAESVAAVTFLILFTILVVLVLIWWLRTAPDLETRIAIGFIIGGALGNIVDRIRLHGVIDFLDFHYRGWHWPAFNIADAAITLGVIVLIIHHFTNRPRPSKTEA